MTRPQVKLYRHYMQRRIFKDMERQATAMWGYDPKAKGRALKQKQLAEKWLEDPLYGFPNDIEYFTRKQIGDKIGITKRFGNRMAPERRWDEVRARACIGRMGAAARRCSMNDKLWSIWNRSRAKGVTLTLETVKKMIRIDIKRSKLYPPGWTDDSVSPPEWYLDELRKKGMLDGILSAIDEAART